MLVPMVITYANTYGYNFCYRPRHKHTVCTYVYVFFANLNHDIWHGGQGSICVHVYMCVRYVFQT